MAVASLLGIVTAGLILRWAFNVLYKLWTVRSQHRDTPGGLIYQLNDPEAWWAIPLMMLPRKKGDIDYSHAAIYEKSRSTVVTIVPYLNARPLYYVADVAALKVMGSDRTTFSKKESSYNLIAFYGANIVSASESDWKRHRDMVKNAFGESNNLRAWKDTTRMVTEWFVQLDEQFNSADVVPVDLLAVMTKIALLVVSSAQFGHEASFESALGSKPPPGHKLSFRSALLLAVDNLVTKLLTPKWVYNLPVIGQSKRLKEAALAYDEITAHLISGMEDIRAEPAAEDEGTPSDLMRLLLRANDEAKSFEAKLSDGEIMSNLFAVLLAGYKTTAGTLAFALTLLALYPDVQKRLQSEADSVWGSQAMTTDFAQSYKNVPRLKYAEAVFRETLRLFPPIMRFGKITAVDTTVNGVRTTSTGTEQRFTTVIPKGSKVWMDFSATQRMQKYWGEDAAEFRPERLLDPDTYPRDAFLPFGTGARACLGQRFATLEGICVLSHVAHRYDILLPLEIAALPRDERMARMLASTFSVSMVPINAHVRFRQRKQ